MKRAAVGVGGMMVLGTAGVLSLVSYALLTADGRLAFPDTPAPELSASEDPDLIARGRYLVYGPAHCAQCHSVADRTDTASVLTTPVKGGLPFDMGPLAMFWGRNLTPDPETGIGALSDAQIARTIRTGVLHDGQLSLLMRLSGAELSDEDIVAVLSYLRSIEPVRNEVSRGYWRPLGKVLVAYAFPPLPPRPVDGPAHVPEGEEPTVERGAYLADHVMLCTHCHTAFDLDTLAFVGPKGGGSLPDPSHGEDKDMEFVAPNLTSHPTGVTGQMSEDAFVVRLKAGRTHASSIMPWESFSITTDSDLRSVYRYLRSLPPVDADLGPTYRKIGWKPASG